jgi:hypothetical protein
MYTPHIFSSSLGRVKIKCCAFANSSFTLHLAAISFSLFGFREFNRIGQEIKKTRRIIDRLPQAGGIALPRTIKLEKIGKELEPYSYSVSHNPLLVINAPFKFPILIHFSLRPTPPLMGIQVVIQILV